MTSDAELGNFVLGGAALGQGPKLAPVAEFFSITDDTSIVVGVFIQELFNFYEVINNDAYLNIVEALTISEDPSYLSDYLAGVYGKITVILDVTSDELCEMILEGGQTITLAGIGYRAFVFIKQSGQKFDQGIQIYPGDAVMFNCPTDPVIATGDEIIFDNKTFTILHIVNHYFDGSIVYRKAALRLKRAIPELPAVGGLISSDNLDGKVTLTWDDLPLTLLPWLDRYEIWEGTAAVKRDDIVGYEIFSNISYIKVAGDQTSKYSGGDTLIIGGSDGNDGIYTLNVAQYDVPSAKTELVISNILKALTSNFGGVINAENHYIREQGKANSIKIKNIVKNTAYYYMVRAVDKYNKPWQFSAEVVTGTDTTPPPNPTGAR